HLLQRIKQFISSIAQCLLNLIRLVTIISMLISYTTLFRSITDINNLTKQTGSEVKAAGIEFALKIVNLETRSFMADALHERVSRDRKSTRLNSSHQIKSYAVLCLKKNNATRDQTTRTNSNA